MYELYKQAKRLSSKVIWDATKRAYDDLYNRLDTKEGEKAIDRKTEYLSHVRCVKHEDGRVLMLDKAILGR